jgi:hypothetical protein
MLTRPDPVADAIVRAGRRWTCVGLMLLRPLALRDATWPMSTSEMSPHCYRRARGRRRTLHRGYSHHRQHRLPVLRHPHPRVRTPPPCEEALQEGHRIAPPYQCCWTLPILAPSAVLFTGDVGLDLRRRCNRVDVMHIRAIAGAIIKRPANHQRRRSHLRSPMIADHRRDYNRTVGSRQLVGLRRHTVPAAMTAGVIDESPPRASGAVTPSTKLSGWRCERR